ncbi:tyrosine-type recombinase/integrase [Chitinimonas sp. BJB300]|uniref:tyrosine-type recombinase/integrase n=1 Tax=Chitinimonas sp. BJB300 TaxID=1559339 RepID=UPI000C11A84B|nr:tyrosine-type recombinase/integrase [Chitinimonas sp. BJB300]PHV10894.1 integrase [Chitinimonas sp. BJB300]TSJ88181.1 tyrosine-type recombinase/integrase [Chitinimonas sp. BJB300]
MGRKRTNDFDLPPRMARKGFSYYYVTNTKPRRWIALGPDLGIAKRKWAELENTEPSPNDSTFAAVAARYKRDVFPTKAPRTQKDNAKELVNLLAVFGEVPLDSIKPTHVRQYLDKRGATAQVRANREKALLSHIFNRAREWGLTDRPNPCEGVKGHRETGRDKYVSDEEYRAVWEQAHFTVQDAMDLAYYSGQRPADVLKLKRSDIQDGALCIKQNKTGKKLRISITGKLDEVISRILTRNTGSTGTALIQDEDCSGLNSTTLRSRFNKARALAKVTFQFRDLRAKAATDINDLNKAQKLLGHKTREMTEHYTRERQGESVSPLDRFFTHEEQKL